MQDNSNKNMILLLYCCIIQSITLDINTLQLIVSNLESLNLQNNRTISRVMFLSNPADSKAYKPFDENLELQEMLAYQSKNDINDTQIRERRLSGDSQNQLQSSDFRLKTSQLHEQFNFLKISGEEYIFQSNCTESISSSNVRRLNFDFQEPHNQSIVTDYNTKELEKCIQMKNEEIKSISLELQSKKRQILDLKQLTVVLQNQLNSIRIILSKSASQKHELTQSNQQQKSISFQWMSFHQNSRINSPKQKVIGKSNIIFNKVSPIYKHTNTICIDEEEKKKIRTEYEKIIECKDKIIDQLKQKVQRISQQLENDKIISNRIIQLQQQLKERTEKIQNLESINRGNDLKMIELSTQDEEVEKQIIQMQNSQSSLQEQLILKQRKIQQLYNEIELKNNTINYTQNQMMKIEIDRINTEIQKQFFKEKLHKYELEHASSNRQESKKTLKGDHILSVASISNSLKSVKFTPQMLSPKQTVDFMVKIIKKAIKSQNIRALLQNSPHFLESINELLQILL